MSSNKILIVVSNPTTSSTTGWPVGFWASELIHPYHEFTKAGFEVVVASPDGGAVELDALSDPRDESGYSKDDKLSMEYLQRPDFSALLKDTRAIADCDPAEFDAIVVAGGQAPMFTFRDARHLQDAFMAFVAAGKVHAALCHGTSLLLYLNSADGSPFVKGRRLTGFTNAEEDYVDQTVGQKVMPFRIEDEARELGATFEQGEPFAPFVLQDGQLITGQQQNSGAATAAHVLSALGVKS